VLVDSERLTVAVEARMLTEMGRPITVDEVVRKFVGGSSDATRRASRRVTVFDTMAELQRLLLGTL
jgi:beta-phosphoglucomutase-like phosphatase (HAD superfamily)